MSPLPRFPYEHRDLRLRAASLGFLLVGFVAMCSSCATADPSSPRATHRRALEARTPAGFTVVDEPPFFVVGDEPARDVRSHARDTVRWAVALLQADYFAKQPNEIIDIWLFRDTDSYRSNTRAIFGETPTTPYGYYSARDHALIMNISTGGGTLVHEIVHPFMRANFPACPPWFDEGLASLYEACGERDGHIIGGVNWRLPGLQQAINDGTTLPFRQLMALSASDFYGDSSGTGYNRYYGQSRYLCFYLQERGLLRRFYREFVANAAADPTGYATLQRVVGEEDMAAFQQKWESFVLRLTPP